MLLALVLLIGLVWWYFTAQGSGSGTLGALSTSQNALTVELCNGYCEKMMGEDVQSIGGIIGGGVEGSKYSFCIQKRDFVLEDDKKVKQSCYNVSKSANNIGIRENCPC